MNDAGRIGFVIRGEYSALATYDFLDVVYYDGASYVAKKLTVGNEPQESNEYWQILAKSNTLTNISDATVNFQAAKDRINIQSGEDSKTLFGKIRKWFADLKSVAFTASYNDLTNQPQSLKNPNALTFTGAVTGNYDGSAAKSVAIPSVGNGTLTIQKNGTNVKTFTANQAGNVTANITVPTSAADVGAVATSKVLTTKEQINANTDASNVAGATAVKAMVSEINSNLTGTNAKLNAYMDGAAMPTCNNANEAPQGWSKNGNAASNGVNFPSGVYGCYLLTIKENNDWGGQLLFARDGSNRLFVRNLNNGAWNGWTEK